jgi:hypothetical protein
VRTVTWIGIPLKKRKKRRFAWRKRPVLGNDMKIDVGKLSNDETKQLLREIIRALPEDDLFEVLGESLTKDQREELGESWFNVDK